MGSFAGYDCDGNGFNEFQILRGVWLNTFPIKDIPEADPREYCIVKASDGNYYAISVFDFQSREIIREREHIPEDQEITPIVKPVSEMVHYEIAIDDGDFVYYPYRDKQELRDKVDEILGLTKPVSRTMKPKEKNEK